MAKRKTTTAGESSAKAAQPSSASGKKRDTVEVLLKGKSKKGDTANPPTGESKPKKSVRIDDDADDQPTENEEEVGVSATQPRQTKAKGKPAVDEGSAPNSEDGGSGPEGGESGDESPASAKQRKSRRKNKNRKAKSRGASDTEMGTASNAPDGEGEPSSTQTKKKTRRSRPKATSDDEDKDEAPKTTRKATPKDKGRVARVTIEEEEDPEATRKTLAEGMQEWQEQSVHKLRADVYSIRENMDVLQEIEAARIGSGAITACGIGNLYGVVRIGTDPNGRMNPRPLNEGHVKALYDILKLVGGKRDSESPIFIVVSRKLITDECAALMATADARNPSHTMPRVKLVRPKSDREDEIENRLYTQWDTATKSWIPTAVLNKESAELDLLRNSRELARLLNGNHRVAALIKLASDITSERDRVMAGMKAGKVDTVEGRELLNELTELASKLTWRVIVYDADKLTPAGQNFLVQNDQQLPAMGTGAGEKGWWLAEHLTIKMAKAMESGEASTREQAINIAHGAWRQELGKGMKVGEEEDTPTPAPTPTTTGKGRGHLKGDLVGEDGVSRLFTEPTTMEMVFDCRAALWAFGNTLTKTNATNMLKPSGAPLAAHFWLALRTLIKLCNVAGGEDLEGALKYLAAATKITTEGDQASIPPWNSLHIMHETTPQYLEHFGEDEAKLFDDMFEKVCNEVRHPVHGIQYDDADTIVAFRELYESFGLHLAKTDDPAHQMLSVSFRLYARLPLAASGASSASFFPAAALPAPRWVSARSARWNGNWKPTRDAIAVIEALMKPYQLVWTMGAAGTSKTSNWNNWYRRSTGLHQLLMGCFEATELGCFEARLSQAIYTFEDLRLQHALHHAQAVQEATLAGLINDACARKSGSYDYPLLTESLLESYGSRLGAVKWNEVPKVMLAARMDLKSYSLDKKCKLTLPEIRRTHPILGAVDDAFWSSIDVGAWVAGWREAEPKQIKSAGAIVGWGLVTSHYRKEVLKPVMRNKHARWLLRAVHDVLAFQGKTPWWENFFDLDDLPHQLLEVPAALRPDPPIDKATKAKIAKAAKAKAAAEAKAAAAAETEASAKESKTSASSRATRSKTNASKATEQPSVHDGDEEDKVKGGAPGGGKDDEASGGAKSRLKRPAPKSKVSIESSSDEGKKGDTGDKGKEVDQEEDDQDEDEKGEAVSEDEDPEANVTWPMADLTIPFATPLPEDHAVPSHVRTRVPRGHQTVRQLLDHLNPGYVYTPNRMSNKTLHGIYALDLSARRQLPLNERLDTDILHRLTNVQKFSEHLYEDISRERQHFRESIVAIARLGVDTPYGSDYAATWMAPTDLFVVRLSGIFCEHTKMSREEGLNEAYALAMTDGLFDEEVVELDEKTNKLSVNLKSTFCQSVQESAGFGEDVEIELGTVPGDRKSRASAQQGLHYMPVARGYGRTDIESLKNGVTAVAKAAFYVRACDQFTNSSLHFGNPPHPLEGPPVDFEYAKDCRMVRDGEYEEELLPMWRQTPDVQTVAPMVVEALSTGNFVGPDVDDCVSQHGSNDRKFIALKEKVRKTTELVSKKWDDAQLYDVTNYKAWFHMSGNAPGTSLMASSSALGNDLRKLPPSAQLPRPTSPNRISPIPSSTPGSPSRAREDMMMSLEDGEKQGDLASVFEGDKDEPGVAKVLVAATQATNPTQLDTTSAQATQGLCAPASSQSLGDYFLSQGESLTATALQKLSTQSQRIPSRPVSESNAESGDSSFVSQDKGDRPRTPDNGDASAAPEDQPVGGKRRRDSIDDNGNDAKRRIVDSATTGATSTPVESAEGRGQFEETPGAPTRPRTGLKPKPPCPKHDNARSS